MEIAEENITTALSTELTWLNTVVDTALTLYFKNETEYKSVEEINPPEIDTASFFGAIIDEYELDFEERLILIFALTPIIKPQCLDIFKIKNKNLSMEYAEFGGIREGSKQAFIPTLETAVFVLSGDDMNKRMDLISRFNHDHPIFTSGILVRDAGIKNLLDQPLRVSREIFNRILTGKVELPEFGSGFPAKKIESSLDWDDLIVDDSVRISLNEISDWLHYKSLILDEWNFNTRLKKGYRVLFYGPPGTGKTFAATLIGKSCEKAVFRVDLSMIVSKYIGETEKNLAGLFDMAEGKDWILFFDEADALFGKRTEAKGSNDRYANQEVAYLLQRIEDYKGLIILATNLKDNIDEAFGRRFQTTVQFVMPAKKERKMLWENYIFSQFELAEDVDKDAIIEDFEITGGEILNILRFCTIRAAKRNEKKLYFSDIMAGIKREYSKQNKTL